MSSLKHVDRIRLERFLEMEGGYVCDFSDRTFRDFVIETTGVDVYTLEYEEGGTSKANRLRTFWKKENDTTTSKLLKEIIEYQKIQKQNSGQGLSATDESLYHECVAIAGKLQVGNIANAEKPIEELSDAELLVIIRRAENTNIPDSLYQRASSEWQIRQSQKMLEATQNKSHGSDLDEIKKGMLELLNDPQYTKRTFSLFKKRFYGSSDDDLRGALRSIGAVSFFGKENGEQWGLRSRNGLSGKTANSAPPQEMVGSSPASSSPVNIVHSWLHFGDVVARDKVGGGKTAGNKESLLSKYYWYLLIPVVVLVLGFIITEGKLPLIFKSNATPSSISTDSTATSTTDFRKRLIGSIFDLVQEMRKIDKDLLREDFVQNHIAQSFDAEGQMQEVGKFESGDVWVTMGGTATDGGAEIIECHFDNSWEKQIRNLLAAKKTNVSFSGEVGYYAKGWIVINDCKILSLNEPARDASL